jgi:hypothetical protein
MRRRAGRLVLIMAWAMHGCVGVGRDDALHHPTALAKKSRRERPAHGSFQKRSRRLVSWFTRGLRRLERCLQNDLPLPPVMARESLIGDEVTSPCGFAKKR